MSRDNEPSKGFAIAGNTGESNWKILGHSTPRLEKNSAVIFLLFAIDTKSESLTTIFVPNVAKCSLNEDKIKSSVSIVGTTNPISFSLQTFSNFCEKRLELTGGNLTLS